MTDYIFSQTHKADAIVVAVAKNGIRTQNLPGAVHDHIQACIATGDIPHTAGETVMLSMPHEGGLIRLVCCGIGDAPLSVYTWQKLLDAVCALLKKTRARAVRFTPTDIAVRDKTAAWCAARFYTALLRAQYVFDTFRSVKTPDAFEPTHFVLACDEDAETAAQLTRVRHTENGVRLTRDVANTPANICTPGYLVEQARILAKTYGLEVDVLDTQQLTDMGCGALLAVGQGSAEASYLIVLRYRSAHPVHEPVALVGKGVTFDTGGISIKPSADMDEMKYDMCGAASVLGVMRAVAESKPSVDVIGVIPTVENMPSGTAVKPGDIVTSLAGKTIEILNTDAEGRLILCDALTYVQRFSPSYVVDIATLTGAVIVALGHVHSAVLGNDTALIHALKKAGEESSDTLWELPLDDVYESMLKSPFADMANISPGRAAGTVTAAAFLSAFCKDVKWAHLDIAGTAWQSGENKGATGRPVPLLVEWVHRIAQQQVAER